MSADPRRGFDPDTPVDSAASTDDEELAFAGSTPPAPDLVPEQGARSAPEPRVRTAAEVLEDHLREGRWGSVEDDLPRNYAPEIVTIDRDGCHRGFEGMTALAAKLRRELPHARFAYTAKIVHGRMGFLEWSAEASNGAFVDDGADSYLIEHGRIIAQTIHYTVKRRKEE